ncbi:G patch domain-containing protein 4 [Petromyzon marinus]|uniref:G patch domain-containing protein 4 n=1 Tax=Petromyzon marinus TaxID=7757 RepID=UPI003F729AEC
METRESGSGRRFAEAQMLKHGWTRGKGLGRFENGRAEAVKVKVKHDTAGIGHDMAEQFTFHWWDHVFNKAAASIEVEGTEEGAKVMGNRSDGAEEPISNRKPRKAHLSTTHALYGNFVKAATLTSGEEVRDEKESSEVETSSSEDEDAKLDLSSTTRMTDEQLLRACGGRTAHKGARHGVNMSAKLARLEQQEREFLSRWGGGGGSARADQGSPRPASDNAAAAAAAATVTTTAATVTTTAAACGAGLKRGGKRKKSKRERPDDNDHADAGGPGPGTEEPGVGGDNDVRSRPKKRRHERQKGSPGHGIVPDETGTAVAPVAAAARDAGHRDGAKPRKKSKRNESAVRSESDGAGGDGDAAGAGGGENVLDTRDGTDGVGDGCCSNNEVAEEEVVVVDRSERKKKKKKKNKKRARERQDGERRGSPAGETNEPKPERSSEEKSVARSDERSAKTAKKRKHKTK